MATGPVARGTSAVRGIVAIAVLIFASGGSRDVQVRAPVGDQEAQVNQDRRQRVHRVALLLRTCRHSGPYLAAVPEARRHRTPLPQLVAVRIEYCGSAQPWYADGMPVASEVQPQIKAIEDNRSLLATPDPVPASVSSIS